MHHLNPSSWRIGMVNFTKAGALLCLLLSGGSAIGQDRPTTKVLFLGKNPDHPFGSHMYMQTCAMLAKCVALTPGIDTTVSNGWPKDAKILEGVKTIVIYTSPAAELLLEGPQRG